MNCVFISKQKHGITKTCLKPLTYNNGIINFVDDINMWPKIISFIILFGWF